MKINPLPSFQFFHFITAFLPQYHPASLLLYQFQIKDDLKAARIEAARRTEEYVEQPKTSQRREGLDM
jgi:hypothetical protein